MFRRNKWKKRLKKKLLPPTLPSTITISTLTSNKASKLSEISPTCVHTYTESTDSDYHTSESTHYAAPTKYAWILPTSPQEDHEWRAVADKTTGRYYFYNRATKETVWEKPGNFKEWKIMTNKDEDTYYYNVLTKVTSTIKPAMNGSSEEEYDFSSMTSDGSAGICSRQGRRILDAVENLLCEQEWRAIPRDMGSIEEHETASDSICEGGSDTSFEEIREGKMLYADENAHTKGKWKAVPAEESAGYYFYNSISRATTWQRPEGFAIWEVATESGGYHVYYYNILTKTEIPDVLMEWKVVKENENNEYDYYYNILKRSTRYNSSAGADRGKSRVKENCTGSTTESNIFQHKDLMNEDVSAAKEAPKEKWQDKKMWKAVPDKTTGLYYFYNMKTRDVTWERPYDFHEWEAVRGVNGDIYYYNVIARVISSRNPGTRGVAAQESSPFEGRGSKRKKKLRQPVKIVSEKERLALSLAGCCPEVCYNELLLRKLRGKEKKTVETIEEMIDGNAPFDEIKGKITSFLKPIADLTAGCTKRLLLRTFQ